jgi:hypothetical protein
VHFPGKLSPSWSFRTFKLARTQCRSCGASISSFALVCPECHAPNQPNPVTTTAALLAIAALGATIAVGAARFGPHPAQQPVSEPATAASMPNSAGTDDYGWIMDIMARCEAEAKRQPDVLRFVVVPMTRTGLSMPGWSPTSIGEVGGSARLLSATHALFGLRNGVLAPYAKPVAFVLSDPNSKTQYKWQPAVGVAEFTSELGSGDLTLGFEMPDVADEIQWGPTVGINTGSCYWINLLVLGPHK